MPKNRIFLRVSYWVLTGLLLLFLFSAVAVTIQAQSMSYLPMVSNKYFPFSSSDIPNMEMLQKAKKIRHRYGELNRRLAKLRQAEADSMLTAEDFSNFRSDAANHLEMHTQELDDWAEAMELGQEEFTNVLGYHSINLQSQKRRLIEAGNLSGVGDVLELAERNFKALLDEHLYALFGDPLEGHLLQAHAKGFKGKEGFYAKGMDELLRPRQLDRKQIAEGFKRRGTDGLNDRMPIKNTELINRQTIPEKFGELNPFRSFAAKDSAGRLFSLGLHYSMMRSWREQVFAHTHIGYRMSHGLVLIGGYVIKKDWETNSDQMSEGYGFQGGLRMLFGDYFLQGAMERTLVKNLYPGSYSGADFEGWVTFPRLDAGRSVSLFGRVKTVFVGTYDPLFQKNERLNGSRFLLKVGFEIQ